MDLSQPKFNNKQVRNTFDFNLFALSCAAAGQDTAFPVVLHFSKVRVTGCVVRYFFSLLRDGSFILPPALFFSE